MREVVWFCSALTVVHELCGWLWQGGGVHRVYMCEDVVVLLVLVDAVGLGIVGHVCVYPVL